MYNFRYYAIGHSYLKHGPFVGWQTSGFWGMAASSAECDYFNKFQKGLKSEFDCNIEAIAENHAAFERLCTVDATEEKYKSSKEYARMCEVLKKFKPNIITLYIGGGNTPANDQKSLTLFFEMLYGLVAENKLKDAVAICVGMNPIIYQISKSVADKYGFISVDASFMHEKEGRDNPYYAFNDYPEYDEQAALGAVEFRTHPSDLAHATIAKNMLIAAKDAIAKIPSGDFSEEYEYEELLEKDLPPMLKIETEPQMKVSYFGFNIRQNGDCVTFGSAPGTGASVTAENFSASADKKTFYAELAVDGASQSDVLKIYLKSEQGEMEYSLPIVTGMNKYEIELPVERDEIKFVRIAPTPMECVVNIKKMGFK